VVTPPPTPSDESADTPATIDPGTNSQPPKDAEIATVESEAEQSSLFSKILPPLFGLFGLAILAGGGFLLFNRRQKDVPVTVIDPDTVNANAGAPIVPVSLPAPVITPTSNLFSELIPVPVEKANNNQEFNRSINSAFYPSMPIAGSAELPKADDIPDMYTVANEHPESYGNTNFIAEPKQSSAETPGIPFKR
jgi:LPXTG-motif cell wall-anchored protein